MTTRRTKRPYNRQPKPEVPPVAPQASAPDVVAAALGGCLNAAPDQPLPQSTIERPEMRTDPRPPMRTSLQEAEARATRNLQPRSISPTRKTIRSACPSGMVPEGWEYEWKTHEVAGKGDVAYASSLARLGWDPVVTDRHPEMMERGAKGAIIRREHDADAAPEDRERPPARRFPTQEGGRSGSWARRCKSAWRPSITGQPTAPRDVNGRPLTTISREFVSPASLKSEGFPARQSGDSGINTSVTITNQGDRQPLTELPR